MRFTYYYRTMRCIHKNLLRISLPFMPQQALEDMQEDLKYQIERLKVCGIIFMNTLYTHFEFQWTGL